MAVAPGFVSFSHQQTQPRFCCRKKRVFLALLYAKCRKHRSKRLVSTARHSQTKTCFVKPTYEDLARSSRNVIVINWEILSVGDVSNSRPRCGHLKTEFSLAHTSLNQPIKSQESIVLLYTFERTVVSTTNKNVVQVFRWQKQLPIYFYGLSCNLLSK